MKKTWILVGLMLTILMTGVMAGGCKSSNQTVSQNQDSSKKEPNNEELKSTKTKRKAPVATEVPTNIEEGEFETIGSYLDLYVLMSKFIREQFDYGKVRTDGMMLESSDASEKTMNSAMEGSTETRTGDYAKTNVAVEGIDEGDIIKTDGSYLYVRSSYYDCDEISNESVVIVRADGAHMTLSLIHISEPTRPY